MKKVTVIGLDTVRKKLISDLMELGIVQITENSTELQDGVLPDTVKTEVSDDSIMKLDQRINRISMAIDTLEKHSTAKKPLFTTRRAMKRSDFDDTLKDREKIFRDVDHVMDLAEQLRKTRDRINRYHSQQIALGPWIRCDIPLEVKETSKTAVIRGVIPAAADPDDIIQKTADISDTAYIEIVGRDKELIYLTAVMLKSEYDEVLTAMKQSGFTVNPFLGYEGTAAENRERIERELGELEQKCSDIEEQIDSSYELCAGIECLYDQLVMERDRERIKGKMLKTDRTFCFEGWVPESCEGSVSAKLDESECYYTYREPEEGEEVPVLMHNSSAVVPFESITEMYSLPDYNGIDPTKYFAFFYAIFFGMMLSDAGYGVIMAAACFIVLRKYQLEGMMYKMVKMFFFCGLATIFWGIMFGGWFGDFFQVAAEVIFGRHIEITPLWFNPIEDPTRLLIWSLAFGIVHLFLGMGIKAAMLIKRGKWIDAVCDIFSWYMVICGAVLWIAGGAVSETAAKAGMFTAAGGILILLLTGGRHNKGFGKITGGLSSVYGITNYISDILSYARLLALGLATGVIATVVNTMGSLAGGGIIGTVILLVVFVIGHTFNMAINSLGAFVHSSRLQYIEFFGKFYEDGGEEFDPFRKNTKYVRLTDNTYGGRK